MAREANAPAGPVRLTSLDALLDTLVDALDIREVFDRVSKVVQPVLPHDLLAVTELDEAGDRFRLLVTAGPVSVPQVFETPAPVPDLLHKAWDVLLVDDVPADPVFNHGPAARAGMKSVLCVPVRFGGRLQAIVNFFSRVPARFTRDDLPAAQRIASYLALAMSHHRLAEESRRRQALESQAATLALLDHLLGTLGEAGDLGVLFDRASAIAGQVLPSDAVALRLLLTDDGPPRGFVRGEPQGLPAVLDVPPERRRDPAWESDRIDDLAERPEEQERGLARLGFRSALRVPVRVDGRLVGVVAFLSRAPAAFKPETDQVARRLAERIALGVAREHGLEAAKRADEASARAARLEQRVRALTEELDARSGYRRLVGDSAPWKQVLVQATQVAEKETTVLLLGESGTGKEVVARFLHRASPRKDGPFVALNCAALPEQLLEAELFGFERGAFTGAVQSKSGRIEQASGGVLFLDEVGEMTPPAQAKFLRVLQEREYQRLAGSKVLRADVRVIAATNRDLRAAMERGAFREDLYYRLAVFEIRLPPLRERRDDLVVLTQALLEEIGRSLGRPPSGISPEAHTALVQYHWPGNVRELRNVLERAAILVDGGVILPEHLAFAPAPPAAVPAPAVPSAPSAIPDIASVERALIEKALAAARYNKSQAAQALGLTRAQLYVRLKRHGLQ